MSAGKLLTDYCAAIDRRDDPQGIASRYWTADGVLDNSAIGSPLAEGHAALAATYSGMFGAMERLEHTLTDMRENADGSVDARVAASGKPVGGEPFAMGGTYRMETEGDGDDRRISRLTFTPST